MNGGVVREEHANATPLLSKRIARAHAIPGLSVDQALTIPTRFSRLTSCLPFSRVQLLLNGCEWS